MLVCGVNASSSQWCGCIFILCCTHLSLALYFISRALLQQELPTLYPPCFGQLSQRIAVIYQQSILIQKHFSHILFWSFTAFGAENDRGTCKLTCYKIVMMNYPTTLILRGKKYQSALTVNVMVIFLDRKLWSNWLNKIRSIELGLISEYSMNLRNKSDRKFYSFIVNMHN